MLVEGAPGSGKSTLSLHICHQWAVEKLFQKFKLVILVRLRDPNIHKAIEEQLLHNPKVLKAKVIADIVLPTKPWTKAIGNWIAESDGTSILFVLDGWDELPKQHQRWFLDIFELGSELPGSSFVITSRPVSSTDLGNVVSSRIVILGFNEKNLREYFKSVLNNQERRANDLIEKIHRNPRIEGSCYLPLNASILVYLYKYNGEYKLPDTQYEIFTKLVCNCITRHLWKMEPINNEID